jgi:predicted phage terminase large subunit-like protein
MPFTWKPNPGPQERFHSSWAFEVLYGGQAGGGKSESLLVEATRYVHVPGYRAIIFRRTFPELAQQDGLIDRSLTYYPELGGTYNKGDHQWTFPSGATVSFGHMEHEDDKLKYKSAQFALICFDELTSFTETQYLYMFSRCRTTAVDPFTGKVIPARIRAGTNPGDVGHEWVQNRFVDKLKPFEIKFYTLIDDVDTEVPEGTKYALSRQFIPASRFDNPKLMERDPEYDARLMQLPLLEREQLAHGNWEIKVSGNVFREEWFDKRVIYYTPPGLKWVRYWDLAASIRTKADFTASGAMAKDNQANLYIRDMYNLKLEWPDAQKVIKEDFLSDETLDRIGIEKKLHGIAAWQTFLRDPDLVGRRIEGIDVDADKLSRALAWSGPAEAGKVFLIDGPWVRPFIRQCVVFDGRGRTHDDMVDSTSGGAKMLGAKRLWRNVPFLHL